MYKDYFKIAWKEIKRKKTRSWLTLIGVFIGIAAIVSLILLGQGMENAIEKQFDMLGKDKLFITPKGGSYAGMGSSEVLTEDDLETVRDTSVIKLAAGMGYTSGRYEFNDIIRYNYISGLPVEPEERALIGEAQTWEVEFGRMLRKGDKYKIVLGHEYTRPHLFETRIELGDRISVNGQEFKVVGFLKKIGSPPDDKSGMVPLDTYGELYDKEGELGFIIAQTQAGEDVEKVGEKVEKELLDANDLDEGEETFTIETPQQLMGTFSTILDIVQIVLLGIAMISLLVGGIGIMNTMFTSVLQRTKEIGVMKALGARNSQVMFLFLVESGLYGLGGGIIGTVIGIGLAKLVEKIFVQVVGPTFLVVEINWWLILTVLVFAFVVGCIAGIVPARNASKLKPVDALRYE